MNDKVILIDGNNFLFRSYYATAYSGNMMKNSKGFPTNALFGFVNMLNKIIEEESPTHILVALDKGKTFRHDRYPDYKAGRLEMPEELGLQFGVAKELLTAMGIMYYEIDNYEADDIIGTFSKVFSERDGYDVLIISSDKDLLQLINEKVVVKLLKTKGHLMMNKENFIKEYGFLPHKIIDLKGLEGDPSDNIPGVKGVGEKTAFKLIKEYNSVEGIYANIDNISGKLKDRLLDNKDKAFMSKQLATIYQEVPLSIGIKDIKYQGPKKDKLISLFEELEFYSFLKRTENRKISKEDVKIIKESDSINIKGPVGLYLEILGSNYHQGEILGLGVYNEKESFFIPPSLIKEKILLLKDNPKYTYDVKKLYVSLKYLGINIEGIEFDTMLSAYLLNYNIKDDIAYLGNTLGYEIPFYEIISKSKGLDEEVIAKLCVEKAKFIYETKNKFEEELIKEESMDLYKNIEFPLTFILGDMEYKGIRVDKSVLKNMGEEIKVKLELLTKDIHNYAGLEFNIASPKQLGEVLFTKMNLKYPGNVKKGYSTNKEVLNKIKKEHPIINKVLEFRMLSKVYGTYIEGLIDCIKDGVIHTIYNQTLTRTGRLSSVEPNLQNIPIRNEYGRLVRKAFLASEGHELMASDYSQIELRVFAHMSKVDNLTEAFKEGMDIHTKTAMDIFNVSFNEVNKEMRRQAKAVNFGILYGISSFGLSEDLDINIQEAKAFIDKYLKTFPGIKKYMDEVIKEAYEKGYVKTLMNRKRKIEELYNKNYMIRRQGERIALNTPIQGSSADILKKVMIDIDKKFKELNIKSKMLLQVHDELIFDVVNEEKEEVKRIVKEIMEKGYPLEVPLKVEIGFGKDWYQIK
ncbi:MAG: DNA polymerase I [Bacilli bacterium]|jgi:DNA polymerase-1